MLPRDRSRHSSDPHNVRTPESYARISEGGASLKMRNAPAPHRDSRDYPLARRLSVIVDRPQETQNIMGAVGRIRDARS